MAYGFASKGGAINKRSSFRSIGRKRHCLTCYSQLSAAMAQVASAFEIIFVEDGGGDGSWPIIVGLAGNDERVRGIRLSRNYGQQSALLCGIRAAKHEIVLTMDDDLQHPVS
jgi:glycosyltransferase involved in cell wall biosynthesis